MFDSRFAKIPRKIRRTPGSQFLWFEFILVFGHVVSKRSVSGDWASQAQHSMSLSLSTGFSLQGIRVFQLWQRFLTFAGRISTQVDSGATYTWLRAISATMCQKTWSVRMLFEPAVAQGRDRNTNYVVHKHKAWAELVWGRVFTPDWTFALDLPPACHPSPITGQSPPMDVTLRPHLMSFHHPRTPWMWFPHGCHPLPFPPLDTTPFTDVSAPQVHGGSEALGFSGQISGWRSTVCPHPVVIRTLYMLVKGCSI